MQYHKSMRKHQNSATQISFILILIFFALIESGSSATAAPTWKGTNYIQAGSMTIVLNTVHQSGTNIYTYTYAPAFSATPFTALGLIGFQTTSLYQSIIKFLINIPNYTSTTSLQIKMNILTTSWRQFRASYIAIDVVFNQLRVDYFSISSLTNVTRGTGLRSYIGVFTFNIPAVNMAHKISIIPLLIGIDCHAINGEHTFYWTSSLRTANSINYNISADRTTQIYSFTSYILVVDRTNAEQGYQIFMDQLYVGGLNNVPTYQIPVYYNLTNMHAGLNSAKFSLSAYNFDKPTFRLTTLGYYQFLNISVWSYRERSCPASQPYYELNTNLCYDTCPTYYLNTNGPTLKYCKACSDIINACQLCSSVSVCTQCVGNYVVSGGSCSCPTGYYVSTTQTLYANKCTSCPTGRTLNGSTCVCTIGVSTTGSCLTSVCHDQSCQNCPSSPDICTSCAATFTHSGNRCICGVNNFYNQSSTTCQSCHYSCQYCSGPASTQCTSCNHNTQYRYLTANKQCLCIQGYIQVSQVCQFDTSSTSCTQPGFMVNQNGQCVQICGDGNKKVLACDDGNTNDGDGCSQKCQIQSGFTCVENQLAPNRRSFCSYTQALQLTLLSMTKDIYSNVLYMNFSIYPSLNYVLQYYPDLTSNTILSSPSIQLKSSIFTNQSSILTITSQFNQSIQSTQIPLTLSIPLTGLTYAIPQYSNNILIYPNNSLTASSYEQHTYSQINIYKIIGMVCYIGGLLAVIFCGFFRKMIGLDYICMLQLVYFSVMLSDFSHAYLGPIQQWNYVNGYNKIKTSITTAVLVPSKFWTLGYYDYFYINCNAMLFVCLANYLIALILYGLSVLSDRSTSRKLKTSAIFFAVDIGFTLVVFNFNNIVVSLFLQAQAGHMFSFTYGLDKFMVLLAILVFVGQMGGYVMKVHDVIDSQLFYHRNKNYCHFYPFIFVIRNLIVILFIVLQQYMHKVSSYICVGIQLAYIIAHLAGRPYKRYIDYGRMLAVQLPLLLLLICHLISANYIADFTNISQGINKFLQYGAIIVMGGMILGLLMTCIGFGYHLWKSRVQDGQVNPENAGIIDIMMPSKDKKKKIKGDDEQEQEQEQEQDRQKSKDKFNSSNQKFKLSQKQKSKQLIMFDMDQEQIGNRQNQTGAPGSAYMGQSIFNQSSKRRLKPESRQRQKMKKMKGKSSQFY